MSKHHHHEDNEHQEPATVESAKDHETSHTDDKSQAADAIDTKDLERQVSELTEALQRERADATNMRRRHDEDLANLRNRTKVNVVRELLPVIDNFERALKHVPKELEGNDYIKGVQGVVKQFEKTLQDMGVEKIKTVGEAFDPRYHEAVSVVEDGDGKEETVAEELQSGYRLGEEVVRHAMVSVRS